MINGNYKFSGVQNIRLAILSMISYFNKKQLNRSEVFQDRLKRGKKKRIYFIHRLPLI